MVDLLRWLEESHVLEFINSVTTVVLAAFALVQLLYIHSERWDRRAAAYRGLWVEQWRIYTLGQFWEREDLVGLSKVGAFEPEAILPRDWGVSSQLLGLLGMQSARFGGVA